MIGGQWSEVCDRWSVVCGQWSFVVSDRWSVVGGQWSVVSGLILRSVVVLLCCYSVISDLSLVSRPRAPLGGGGYFESPSRFLAISSKPMQISPPNLQYSLSQHFYILC